MEGSFGRRHHATAQAPRRELRLEPRALHARQGSFRSRHESLRRTLPGRPDLPRQAAGELGPAIPDRHLRPRSRDARSEGPFLALPLSAGRRLNLQIPDRVRRSRQGDGVGDTRLHRGRHHASGDDAGRYGRGRASDRRALCEDRRQAGKAAAHRPPHSHHRGRLRRPGQGHRRGEDHARRTTSTTTRSASATSCR